MSKVILICGKICSGKTTYAKNIAKKFSNIFEESKPNEINIWYKNNDSI